MKKWEYLIEGSTKGLSLPELNNLGNEGWELVYYHSDDARYHKYIFKREKPKPVEPPEVTARKEAAIAVLHDESLDQAERLDRACDIAMGRTDPPADDPNGPNRHPLT